MEELKMLVEMVAKLPALAIWVLVMFWAYKVMVVGSVYGLIRFVVSKAHDYLTRRKVEVKTVEVRPILDGIVIQGQVDRLIAQIHRVRMHVEAPGLSYAHGSSIEWLRLAIDEKIAKDFTDKPVKVQR